MFNGLKGQKYCKNKQTNKTNSAASHPLSEEPGLALLAAVFPHSAIPSGPHCAYSGPPSTAATQIVLHGWLCANGYCHSCFLSLHANVRDWKAEHSWLQGALRLVAMGGRDFLS